MKLIHSAWTLPALEKRWQIEDQLKNNLWLYAYSFLRGSEFTESFVLYTDNLGQQFYGEIGYDRVTNRLEDLALSTRFWSYGKIIALQDEPLGSVHIDGDVFFRKKTMIDVIDSGEYDVIVQGEERLSIFLKYYFDTLYLYPDSGMPFGFDKTLKHSVNCGVLGFRNEELRQDFFHGYFKMVEILMNNKDFMRSLHLDPKIEPNIIEQFFLAGLIKAKNSKVKTVLPLPDGLTDIDKTITLMNKTANEIGYTHAWGSTKYNLIDLIRQKIKERDFGFYRKILNIEKNIKLYLKNSK